MAEVARLLPLGFAFGAGIVASVNPCGVLMLPGFFLHQLRSGRAAATAVRRVLTGLRVAVVVTAGFS